ncbi:MAG: hypothetical protein SPJ33_09685 [Clostridium sp.]|nr:hypothetical protein [Clostridium sp.]
MQTIIDTMGIVVKDMPQIQDTLTLEWIGCNSKLDARVKVNIHARYGEHNIARIREHIRLTRRDIEDSCIGKNEVRMERMDIAIDTNKYTFAIDFKKLMLFGELLSIRQGGKVGGTNRYYTTDIDSLLPNSIKFKQKRDLTIEIYNKKLESPTHQYETRIEFRYDRKDRDIENCLDLFDNTIELLKAMEGNLQRVEGSMIERLSKLYKKQVNESLVKSFSEFVRKYNDYFYTLEILKGVYKNSGLKGNYNTWLKEFRKLNDLEFITKTEIRKFQKTSIKSVREYIKG